MSALAKTKDFERELENLFGTVEAEGAAQAEEIGLDTGQVARQGFWRIDTPVTGRSPGKTLTFTNPDEKTFRFTIPKNGCTADTLRIFTRQAERFGFDFELARNMQKARDRDRATRLAEEAAARELALHQQQQRVAADKPAAPARKKRKKWPREEINDCDVNASYAQSLLDDPGDGTLKARPIYRSNVNRFKRKIKNKTWRPHYTHVDWFGFVLNGRHRFTAVVELAEEFDDPDFSVPFKIIFGVDPALYPTFDTDLTRSPADTLVIGGHNPAEGGGQAHKHMAAALKIIHFYKESVPWGSWSKIRLENEEVLLHVDRYPLIYQAMEMATRLYLGKRRIGQVKFRPTAAIVFCYLVLERYPECWALMEEFINGVTLGEHPGGDPRRALYNLMRERTSEEAGGETLPGTVKQLALLLKAWKQYCTGYRYRSGGAISWRKGERLPMAITASEVTIDIPIPAVL